MSRYLYITDEFACKNTLECNTFPWDARNGGIPTSHLPLAIRITLTMDYPKRQLGELEPVLLWRRNDRWRPAPVFAKKLFDLNKDLYQIHRAVRQKYDQSPLRGYIDPKK